MDELLRTLGLNDNEREVYVTVLKAGKIAPNRVAATTGINRTTVYSIASKLTRMGLIQEDVGQRSMYYLPQTPEAVQTILKNEEQQLAQKKKAAVELAHEMSHISANRAYSVPRIKFVEEDNLADYLYQSYPRWRDNLEQYDQTWWGFHDDSFTKEYGEFIQWSWAQARSDLKVRFFSNNAAIEGTLGKLLPERQVKPLPQEIEFDSSFWIAGDYILMVQTRVRPHYMVEIFDAVLSRNQRNLFRGLWSLVQ